MTLSFCAVRKTARIFIQKMNKYFFSKSVDKILKLWYYISVPREEVSGNHLEHWQQKRIFPWDL